MDSGTLQDGYRVEATSIRITADVTAKKVENLRIFIEGCEVRIHATNLQSKEIVSAKRQIFDEERVEILEGRLSLGLAKAVHAAEIHFS